MEQNGKLVTVRKFCQVKSSSIVLNEVMFPLFSQIKQRSKSVRKGLDCVFTFASVNSLKGKNGALSLTTEIQLLCSHCSGTRVSSGR